MTSKALTWLSRFDEELRQHIISDIMSKLHYKFELDVCIYDNPFNSSSDTFDMLVEYIEIESVSIIYEQSLSTYCSLTEKPEDLLILVKEFILSNIKNASISEQDIKYMDSKISDRMTRFDKLMLLKAKLYQEKRNKYAQLR